MNRRLNILLIQPRWMGLSYRRKIKVNERRIHPLSLGVVATLSGDHTIKIIDEAIENVPKDTSMFDIVGISVNTYTAPRAFQLADTLLQRKNTVILGGVHTSLNPDECLLHASSIIIGDAEDTWPPLLEDFIHNNLKDKYISSNRMSGKDIPAPRRDLFKRMKRRVAYCQISRGCSNQCRFCYLQYMPSKTFRLRDIDDVYNELKSLDERIILFVDDNLFCDREYLIEFLKRIAPLGKRWWIQAPTDIYNDEELISLLSGSGCFSLSIGFQTALEANNFNESIFQNKVDNYKKLVNLLHKYGILVDGTFIFGFDGDTKDTFRKTEELIRFLGIDTYTFYLLTPYPGTTYFEYFFKEKRILTSDLSFYDWDHAVIRPKNMAECELIKGVEELYDRLDKTYYLKNIIKNIRIYNKKVFSRDLLFFLLSLGWNYRVSNKSPQFFNHQ
ncbi:MAG: B12-binding domain-containing radical SAM protein [bacterium]